MHSFTHTIRDALGLHARPAGQLLAHLKDTPAAVTVCLNGRRADAKNLIQMIALNARQGDTVTVTVEGPGEGPAAAGLEEFFRRFL